MDSNRGKSTVYELDETDVSLLHHLQKNARYDIKELSIKLNISKTPIYERIKRLEQEGYIKEYVAVLDRKKIGKPLMVFCAVSLSIQNAEYIELFNRQVKDIEEIVECHLTGGVFDFILKVVVSDLEEYNNFASNKLATIQNVGKIQSSFVLNEMKNTNAIFF